jgi:FtsP/CotA-like multicopper oxidase with cupredoxin domain
MRMRLIINLIAFLAMAVMAHPVAAAGVRAAPGCQRPTAGSPAVSPPELFSKNGVLNVDLDYVSSVDRDQRVLFCFVTPSGLESPTLHVKPGDLLNINLYNKLPSPSAGAAGRTRMPMSMPMMNQGCGALMMDASSVNIHYHGVNTSPTCHSDDSIFTLVNSNQHFDYHIRFPPDEPPGLYWYHPHVHGQSEAAVQGGASGAIIVDGIQNTQPEVAGLPPRVLIIRDQIVAGALNPGGRVPAWDLSLNYVPIAYPALTPAIIQIASGRREFWRVLNASADTVADIDLNYDGAIQPLKVVALDGVATGSQDGAGRGAIVEKNHILIPPAGRAEFIVLGPPPGTRRAVLETRKVDTGPDGDNDTTRTLAVMQPSGARETSPLAAGPATLPSESGPPTPSRFAGLADAPVTVRRKLYFSEVVSDPSNPASPTNFYITVDGAKPTLFDPANPPAIVTTQGAVEEWTIENRAEEVHEFHIHQIHFKLMAVNGSPVPVNQRQFLDTVQVPYWDGSSKTYPSVTVLMDFRGNITGDFVYHCHILGHEDAGMMAIIRVLPSLAAGG